MAASFFATTTLPSASFSSETGSTERPASNGSAQTGAAIYGPKRRTAQETKLSYDEAALTQPSDGLGGRPAYPSVSRSARTLRIRSDAASGSFLAQVFINGVEVTAIIDTGAQATILSARDARATGADRDVTHSETMAGIGGLSQLNVTRVRSMMVGGQDLGGFSAIIGQSGIPYTLLGQTELSRLGRIVIQDGVMTIGGAKNEDGSYRS